MAIATAAAPLAGGGSSLAAEIASPAALPAPAASAAVASPAVVVAPPAPTTPAAPVTPAAVDTHCPYCALQCGLRLSRGAALEDGQPGAMQVAPWVEFPVTRGGL